MTKSSFRLMGLMFLTLCPERRAPANCTISMLVSAMSEVSRILILKKKKSCTYLNPSFLKRIQYLVWILLCRCILKRGILSRAENKKGQCPKSQFWEKCFWKFAPLIEIQPRIIQEMHNFCDQSNYVALIKSFWRYCYT